MKLSHNIQRQLSNTTFITIKKKLEAMRIKAISTTARVEVKIWRQKLRTTKIRKRESSSQMIKNVLTEKGWATQKNIWLLVMSHRWRLSHFLTIWPSHSVNMYSTALNYCTWASCWYCDLISSPVPISGKKNDLFSTCEERQITNKKTVASTPCWEKETLIKKLNKIQWILWA